MTFYFLRNSRQRLGRQHHRDRGAFSQGAVYVQFSAVAVHDMFDDRKAKTSSTEFTAAVPINAGRTFRSRAAEWSRVHARPIINDLESHARGAQSRLPRDSCHPQAYAPARRAIFKSVSNDIGEYLRQLI